MYQSILFFFSAANSEVETLQVCDAFDDVHTIFSVEKKNQIFAPLETKQSLACTGEQNR